MEKKDYAPPAPPFYISSLEQADKSVFLELPTGYYGGWHPTPVKQWIIIMAGSCELEAGDGEKVTYPHPC